MDDSKFLKEFEEIRLLGVGGYGVVTECVSRLDKHTYAVKKVSTVYCASTQAEILREAEVMVQMDHPNIIRYFHVWVEPSIRGIKDEGIKGDEFPSEAINSPCIYLLMEPCKSSLSDYIEDYYLDGGGDERTSQRIFCECLRAVAYVHRQGYVHGDISSANIFLDGNDVVKLGDFGLALKIGNEQDVLFPNSAGNTRYSAPERRGGSFVNRKIDIYSLGILLVELIHPMKTDSERRGVIDNLKRGGTTPDEWSDHPFTSIIEMALAENPSDRPTATQMLRMVEDVLIR